MKTLTWTATAALIGLVACTPPQPNTVQETTGARYSADSMAECYVSYANQDTVMLRINPGDTTVTGDLEYLFYEKDHNMGTITGAFHGDTLLANYLFWSEGMESEREVAFLRRGDSLLEGYASVIERDSLMAFADRDSLRFGDGYVLTRTDCPI